MPEIGDVSNAFVVGGCLWERKEENDAGAKSNVELELLDPWHVCRSCRHIFGRYLQVPLPSAESSFKFNEVQSW
jgi:hypothetical protein